MTKDNLTQFSTSLQEFNSQLPILQNLISGLYAHGNNLLETLPQLSASLKNNKQTQAFSDLKPVPEDSDIEISDVSLLYYLRAEMDFSPEDDEVWLKSLGVSSIEELPQETILSEIAYAQNELNYRAGYCDEDD